MTVLIRRAAPEEYDAVGRLTETAYEDFLDGPEDFYRAALRDAARRDREAELWVAVDDHGVLGTVTWCPAGSPWRELSAEGEGEFRMLAVHPDARGRGVGRALVRHCEQLAVPARFTRMWLTTIDDMLAAQRLYRRLGYLPEPARDWHPQQMPHLALRAWTKEL